MNHPRALFRFDAGEDATLPLSVVAHWSAATASIPISTSGDLEVDQHSR